MLPPKSVVTAGTKRLFWALVLALLAFSAPALAGAKAVIVVGPVDPPGNARTKAYIAEAEQIARIMEDAGYRVERLYHPHATWRLLRQHARGADLLVYYGHGNGQGWLGHTGPEWVNGLCLTHPDRPNGTYAGKGVPGGNANDLAGLDLSPGCTVVMVHACYAAGSSKLDRKPVDYQTATTRVTGYAQAFFRAGAAYYVAVNYVGLAPRYLRTWASEQPAPSAFLATMQGRRVHAEPGLLLVEERSRPSPHSPWASACVTSPTQLAAESRASGQAVARRTVSYNLRDRWRQRQRQGAPILWQAAAEADGGGFADASYSLALDVRRTLSARTAALERPDRATASAPPALQTSTGPAVSVAAG